MNLIELLNEKRKCNRCELREHASQVVLPHLPEKWEVPGQTLWLGRNPGETEDHDGVPFVGQAGKELNGWFEYLGWDRASALIENACACYSPQNRAPTIHEIAACSYWLEQELKILRPRLIIALGNDAALALNIEGKHGEVLKTAYGAAYLLWHPSFVMRKPSMRPKLYADLDKLQKVLRNQAKVAELRRQYEDRG